MDGGTSELQTDNPVYCVECGEATDDDSTFCPECGAAIAGSGESPETTSPSEDVPADGNEGADEATNLSPAGSGPRKWPFLLGGSAALVAVAVGAFWFINQRDDSNRSKEVLTAIRATEEWLAGRANDLDSLGEIAAFANDAGRQAAAIKSASSSAAGISDESQREALEGVAGGLTESLQAFGRASKLNGESVEPWRRERGRIQAGVASIGVGWPEAVKLARAEGINGFPSSERLASIVRRCEVVISTALRRISAWKASVRAAERTKSTQLAELAAYEANMRAEIGRYASLREATSSFIERANTSGSGVTFDEAYSFITEAQSNRTGVQTGMRNLTPPVVAVQSHSLMVEAIGEAVSALSYAYQGLQEYQEDKGSYYRDYYSFKETPSWQEWNRAGGAAASKWSSAVSSWESGVQAARTAIRNRPPPRKPKV